ncbi:MAG: hypothetical protein RL215_2088 [Planctomycetota bacterium]|jgi:sphingosine kinase
MSARQILAVVNPRSGSRRSARIVRQLQRLLQPAGFDVTIATTSHPGHAAQIAATADLQPLHCLAVVGGDGTIHEIVNGLLQRDQPVTTPLAIVPAGTGNAIALQYQLSSVRDAARCILQGIPAPLDMVKVQLADRLTYCVNIVGWGAATDINITAEKLRWLGRSRYSIAALLQILSPAVRTARITLDDQTLEEPFLFAVLCNTRYAGHRMLLTPAAQSDDGLLDVLLLRPGSRRNLLRVFQGVADGTHLQLPNVEYRQVRSLKIHTAQPCPLNLDGELSGQTPFTATVLPGALRVLS